MHVRYSHLTYYVLAAAVRVRPAFAGEGRYFVRVPLGKGRRIPSLLRTLTQSEYSEMMLL